LVGGKDDWTPAAPCATWGARVADQDRLNVVVYPNAWHRFDGHRVAEAQGSGGITHHVQPDPDAAADAQSRMDAFFARWLR
jgi:dienelactone hydrolase